MTDRDVETAYSVEAAVKYDERRFTDAAGAMIHQRELDVLQSVLARLPRGAKVLEVGCGTGRLMLDVLDDDHYFEGTDASEAMLAEFQKKLTERGLEVPLIKAEAARLVAPSNSFDLVYSIRLLNQTESPEYARDTIRDMLRVSRPGGLVLVEFVNRARPRRRAKTTRLGVREVLGVATQSGARCVDVQGVFLLGMSAYHHAPRRMLAPLDRFDRRLSRVFPRLTARCYVLLAKADGA